jgi:hypothetical protein
LEAFLLDLAAKAAGGGNGTDVDANLPLWERPVEERAAVWNTWCESHRPVNHFVDDSRESVYAGRGE